MAGAGAGQGASSGFNPIGPWGLPGVGVGWNTYLKTQLPGSPNYGTPGPVALDPNITKALAGAGTTQSLTPAQQSTQKNAALAANNPNVPYTPSAPGVSGISGGVVTPSSGGENIFTSPHLYDRDTLERLNSGELLFGSRNGPISLAGKLGSLLDRAGGNRYQTTASMYRGPEGDRTLSAVAQVGSPDDPFTGSTGVRQLADGRYQLADGTIVGAPGTPMSPGSSAGASNVPGLVTPGLRNPTNIPTGGAGAAGFNWDPTIFSPNKGQTGFPYTIKTNPHISSEGAPDVEIAKQFAQALNAIAPGFSGSIPDNFAGFDPDNRANAFNYLAGMYANDPAGIAGAKAGPVLGAAMNLTQQQAANQKAVNDLAIQLLGQDVAKVQNSPAVSGAHNLGLGLAADPFLTSNDALQAEIEGIIARRAGNAAEGAKQSIAGAAAAAGRGGGETSNINAGVDSAMRARLADALAQAKVDQALRRSGDVTAAVANFGGLGNIFRSNILEPSALQTEALGNSLNNPFFNSLVDQMRNLGILGLNDELRESAQNFAQRQTLIGGGIGLLGSVLGGGLGAAGQAQGFSKLFS